MLNSETKRLKRFKKKEKYSISLFLGAGASHAFGYPTTSELKSRLFEEVKSEAQVTPDPNLKIKLLTFLPLLNHKGFPDIEYIFEFLKQISKSNIPEVHNFISSYSWGGNIELFSGHVQGVDAKHYFEFSDFFTQYLINHLFDIFRWKQSVNNLVIEIYSKLCSLGVGKFDRIHVFTTNYDSVIENFCRKRYSLVDGFEHEIDSGFYVWNPELFDTEIEKTNSQSDKKKLFLYKIHGSLTWKKDYESRIVKIPHVENLLESESFSGITLVSPTRTPKDDECIEPFKTLIEKFAERIELCDVCIVIGYSFRDSLNETFRKFLANDGKLLIVISPTASLDIDKNFLNNNTSKAIILPERYHCQLIKNGVEEIIEHSIMLINYSVSAETIDDIIKIIEGYLSPNLGS